MRPTPSFLAALTLGALLAACNGGTGASTTEGSAGSTTAAAPTGEVLGTVNGVSVTVAEFEEAAARKTPENGESLTAAEKQEVLDRIVAEKLLYKAALEKGLDKDPKVQKVMVNTLLREVVYSQVRNSDFTDEELQAYYEANKDEFVVPEKVQIKRILIKVTDERTDDQAKAEAERIRGELVKNPDSFKDLAAQHSEDPYRRRGGDVGFVAATGKPGLDDGVVTKAFTMQVGEISDVFKTEDGYNVITVANKRERVERTFQQMKGSVLRKVKNERLKSLYDKYVEELKVGAKVEIDQARLDGIEINASQRPPVPGLSLGDRVGPEAMEGLEPPGGEEPMGEGEGEGAEQ